LAAAVRNLLSTPAKHTSFPSYMKEWLIAQQTFSELPNDNKLLIELFPHRDLNYLTAYTFEGRPTNQTLGFLLTHRLQREGYQPVGFSVSDYGISVWCISRLNTSALNALWDPNFLEAELNDWLERSTMLKRFFRTTAVISGLTERKFPGQSKTGKQVTFSTDLIYDVLHKYDSNHLLLRSNRLDAERELIHLDELRLFLTKYQHLIHYRDCERITPFSIPIILESSSEGVGGSGTDALLALNNIQEKAEYLYQEALNG
jgi:ATP-dependent Lhr-like helicase